MDPTGLVEPSPKRLAHIGGVCMQWAVLELVVSSIIWKLINLEAPIGKIVTGGLDMGPRVNMAINLAEALKSDRRLIKALRDARAELQAGMIDERNLVVHGFLWNFEGEVPHLEVHRGKGGRRPRPYSDRQVYELGERIHGLTMKVAKAAYGAGDPRRRPSASERGRNSPDDPEWRMERAPGQRLRRNRPSEPAASAPGA